MNFQDHFWNEDLGDLSGFQVLCEQMKKGRRVASGVADFIKARADLEDNYGRQLLKVCQKQKNAFPKEGTFGVSWDSFHCCNEESAQSHLQFSASLKELAQELMQFRKTQDQKRKPLEQGVKKLHHDKKSAWEKLKKAKEDYVKKSEALQSLLKQVGEEKDGAKLAKLEKLLTKARSTQNDAKNNYANLVDSVNGKMSSWENETEETLKAFQEMEEERLQFLRQVLSRSIDLGAENGVQIDKMWEHTRMELDNCDVQADLSAFVEEKRTGSKRPEAVIFESHSVESAAARKVEGINDHVTAAVGSSSGESNSVGKTPDVENNNKPKVAETQILVHAEEIGEEEEEPAKFANLAFEKSDDENRAENGVALVGVEGRASDTEIHL